MEELEVLKQKFAERINGFNKCIGSRLDDEVCSELHAACQASGVDAILGEDDGCDTDLYCCVITNGNEKCWAKFYIEVQPKTNIVLDIDSSFVDISTDGKLYECLDLTLDID